LNSAEAFGNAITDVLAELQASEATYIADGYDKYSTKDYLLVKQNLSYADVMAGELSDR
jgi:hypothetical protein